MSRYQFLEIQEPFAIRILEWPPQPRFSDPIERHVDEIWDEQKQVQGDALFNGQILSTLSYDTHELVGEFVEYRYHVAQIHDPALRPHLQVKTVSVTGITTAGDDVLIGHRSDKVAEYQNQYELAPSGGVDPEAIIDGVVDIRKQVILELTEETGIAKEAIQVVHPLVLARHNTKDTFEFCVSIEIDPNNKQLGQHPRDEYQELFWLPKSQLQNFADEKGDQLVSLSRELIQFI